jgi:hypothetical protein
MHRVLSPSGIRLVMHMGDLRITGRYVAMSIAEIYAVRAKIRENEAL